MSNRPPSLCDACAHVKIVRTGRGSEFLFCLRSKDDPRYAKYPPLPVVACPGFEPSPTSPDEPS